MKQLLFLLLFPCLALAQYQGNANQKITLGEQTTADGLVYRGVASIDTVTATSKITRANKQDTSAYLLLDTVTNLLWHYKIGSNGWIQAGGSTLDTGAMLSPYWRSGRFSGVLPVANGGTGADMSSLPNNYLLRKNSFGIFDTSSVYEAGGKVGIGLIPDIKLHIASPIGSDFLQYTDNETYKTPRFGVQVTSNYGKLLFNSYNIPMYLSSGKASSTGGIVAIQTGVLGSEVERFRINEDGKVGIGTDNPNATLEVYKSSASVVDAAKFGGNFGHATFNNYGDLLGTYATTVSILTAAYTTNTAGFGTKSDSDLAIFTNSARRATVLKSGEFGIGTATPLALLNVMGTVRINSASAPDANYYLQLENSSSQKAKANAWDTYSDKRIKTDIQPIVNAINKVNLLNPVYYQKHDSYVENDFLNIDFDSSVKSLGFIAQEVYNVIPEAVNTGTTNELWAMDYTKIIPILTKAIQEQQVLIKALEQRIINLENK